MRQLIIIVAALAVLVGSQFDAYAQGWMRTDPDYDFSPSLLALDQSNNLIAYRKKFPFNYKMYQYSNYSGTIKDTKKYSSFHSLISIESKKGNNNFYLSGHFNLNQKEFIGEINDKGDTLWINRMPTVGWQIRDLVVSDNNDFYVMGEVSGIYTSGFIAKYDSTGNQLWAIFDTGQANAVNGPDYLAGTKTSNGGVLGVGYGAFKPNETGGAIMCSPNGNVIWNKNYNNFKSIQDVVKTNSNYILIGLDTSSINPKLEIAMIDQAGNMIWDSTYNDYKAIEGGLMSIVDYSSTNNHFILNSCCNLIKINKSGNVLAELSDFIDNYNAYYSYIGEILVASSNELFLSFRNGDIYKIDSTGRVGLDLGPDKKVCQNNCVTIQPQKSYSSYQWSTGSTDTSIVRCPSNSETLWLNVQDSTGRTFSDTIQLTHTTPYINNFTLGSDTSFCHNHVQTITSSGHNGLNYQWNGPISKTTEQPSVTFRSNQHPDNLYQWKVNVADTNNCHYSDSINYSVNVCDGDTVSMQSFSNFPICNSYCLYLDAGQDTVSTFYWSTGDTTSNQYIKVCPFGDTTIGVEKVWNQQYSTYDTITLTQDSCNTGGDVWPGDCNNNGIANNYDVLNIGMAYNQTGLQRPNASLNWTGQSAPDWSTNFNSGLNHKYADCNGDGLIDSADVQAVNQNYGLTHQKKSQAPVGQPAPQLTVELAEDTVPAGDTATILTKLGDSTQQANNIYGVAYSLGINPSYLDPSTEVTRFDSTWLGNPGQNLLGFSKSIQATGQLDVAVTRTDQTNNSGKGLIARSQYITIDNISGKDTGYVTMAVTLQNYKAIDANGSDISLQSKTDTLVIDPKKTSISPLAGKGKGISLYPNPTSSGKVMLRAEAAPIEEIKVYNALGKLVLRQEERNWQGRTSIDISDHNEGVYYLKLKTDRKTLTKKFVHMK